MRRYAVAILGFTSLCLAALTAQDGIVLGDRTTPLRPLAAPNVGVSNAVLRNQPDVRALRVVVEPGGSRVMHTHDDVTFHLFVPITGAMTLDLDGRSVEVPPWQPYYLKAHTSHGFHNGGAAAVEVMEIFIR